MAAPFLQNMIPSNYFWSIIDLQYYITSYWWTTFWYDILYILWNDCHCKSSYHLSPYKFIIGLLTIFLMLYITSLGFIYDWNLYCLIPFTYFAHHLTPLPYSFIHSFVDGHLGCFCILAIVDNAAMNIGMHKSFSISVFIFFGQIPTSRILDCMIVPFLVFWGPSILLSIVAAPNYIPINSAHQCTCFHTSSPVLFSCLFEITILSDVRQYLIMVLILHFPDDCWFWPSFHALVSYLYVSLRQMSAQVLGPLF